MEEKKQTNRLSYSASGKAFRGLLCMLTFCVFIAGLMFSIYAVDTYGYVIITNPKKDFRDTELYRDDVIYEMCQISWDLQQVYFSDKKDGIVTIVDGTKKKSYNLDLNLIEMAQEEGKYLTDLESFLKNYRVATNKVEELDVGNYSSMIEFLKQKELQDSYLYLDTEGFKDLFRKNGYRNTGYRFSGDYSENAYFVFDFQGSYLEEELAADDESPNIITRYDLSEEQYAVYDPAEDIFYSVWDDSFEPMSSYLYRIGEIEEYVSGQDKYGNRYDSIIIPLLKTYNYSFSEFAGEPLDQYNEVQEAEQYLNACDANGIFYRLEVSLHNQVYSNVEETSDIVDMENSYRVKKRSSSAYDFTNADGSEAVGFESFLSEDNNDLLAEQLAGYPINTNLYLAIDTDKVSAIDNLVTRHYKKYSLFSGYARPVLAVTVVSFILIILQAVWLIYTTGRKKKKDTEVALNWFDRMPTEVWFVVCAALLFVSLVSAWNGRDYLSYDYGIFVFCAGPAVLTLPFAFFLMILTLSFVRRIKAGNLWKCSVIHGLIQQIRTGEKVKLVDQERGFSANAPNSFFGKVWAGIINKTVACKMFLQGLAGTTKLLIWFVLYVILNVIVADLMVVSGGAEFIIILILYLLLQLLLIRKVRGIIRDTNRLIAGVKEITQGNLDYKIAMDKKSGLYQELTDGINHIGDGLKVAVETSLKDERMKTELITNVSHDLKTPLTSIINYINLLKTEKMPTPEAEHYVEVLDGKAQRLKQLTEDLVEAAKVTSGNIELERMPLAFDELMRQALGEFEDKFAARNLTVVANYPEQPAMVMADGRRMYRIIENVLQNAYKYALEGTRIYADLTNEMGIITFTLKNISAAPLNISPDELMERFTRGDSARTTEGSGLGLSIAKDLTRLQNGNFEIILDGDLFKVIITFSELEKKNT